MGVNLWGVSPLYENLWYSCLWILPKVRAEGKGGRATDRLKEAGEQTCEPTDPANGRDIQGLAPGRVKLGSARYQAILTGLSRKSYWHLAKTLSTNMGLSKAFLEKQGLVSIRTLWIQIHYPAKAS